MGRAPSWGSRRASPISATRTKSSQRAHCESTLMKSRRRLTAFSEREDSSRLAPHFNLDVVVQLVGRVPVAVKTKIAAFHALGIDELALIGFDIIQILARAQTKLILEV